jgi:DNA (cytosine-5)-methyltransferase 1
MKFIDWFAGVGGFRMGMELAGHECVGFCEFDKYAVMSYTAMHLCTKEQLDYLATLPLKERQKEILKEEYRNGEWYANDVRSVDARSIPDSDCWCFGFPCQDISVAGKQLGFTGNRSSLFFRVMYMVGQLEEEKRPTYLFIENVKNLLSVNGGWDFARLLTEMDRGGYDAEWSVPNSKHFGVPQNSERCFIVGHLRGRSTAEVFPVEGTDGADSIHGIGHRDGYRRNTQVFDSDGITEALDTGQGGGRGHHTIKVIANTRPSKVADRTRILSGGGYQSMPQKHGSQRPSESRVVVVGNTNPSGNGMNGNCYFSEGVNPTLTCNKNEGNRVAIPVLTPERANKRQNGRRFKEDGEEAFTLTSQDRHGVAVEVSVEPVQMSGCELSEQSDEAHSLNCTDQRKVFGAHQKRTMVGYNATLKRGGGMTETALALNARDYKGLSGSNQMMTAAAMLIGENDV